MSHYGVSMTVTPAGKYSAHRNSPTSAGLAQAESHFPPVLEAEYAQAHLLHNRALVCAACILGAAIGALRGFQLLHNEIRHPVHLIDLVLVVGSTSLLAMLACSSAYERRYLPLARIIVPLRNMVIAAHAAHASTVGEHDLLLVLPMIVIGPFFFLGLPWRTALLSTVLSSIAFVVSATIFHVPLAVMLQSLGFAAAALVTCAIAAWQLDKRSRIVFLETRRIAQLAQHDALTWTKNRHVFDEELMRLWEQAIDSRRGLAVMLIDVDHFKAFNDRHGHQAGDHALRRVAQTLQQFVTGPDSVLARYGGEEFAAVICGLDPAQAAYTAERMRQAVQELRVNEVAPDAAVTISIGIAAIQPVAGRDAYGAVQLADQALYQAKMKGRNRVELMGEAEHQMLVTGAFASGMRRQSAAL